MAGIPSDGAPTDAHPTSSSTAADATRMRHQAALTTSTGTTWLVGGGLFTLVALAILIPMAVQHLPPRGLARDAAIVVGALYAFMIVVRLAVRVVHQRLWLMGATMMAIALVSLICVAIVAVASISAAR